MLLERIGNIKGDLQHSHAEVWVEGAPVIGENTEKEICEFICKYVTC